MTLATNPTNAVAIVIPPNTSANRKLTTRAMSSGGVRSWNSVWLGMTKRHVRDADAEQQREHRPGAAGSSPRRITRTPNTVYAAMISRPFAHAGRDEAQREPADQVAEADRRLHERVGRRYSGSRD